MALNKFISIYILDGLGTRIGVGVRALKAAGIRVKVSLLLVKAFRISPSLLAEARL